MSDFFQPMYLGSIVSKLAICMGIKLKGYQKGTFTVEAAFVMLTVIFVLYGIIYLVFYLQDMSQVQIAINESLQEESSYQKYPRASETGTIIYKDIYKRGILECFLFDYSREKKVKEEMIEKLKDKLLVTKLKEIKAEKVGQSIKLTVRSQLNIGISQVKVYFSGTGIEHIQEMKITPHNPAEFVRGYETIEAIIDNQEGYQLLKNLMYQFNKFIKG